MSGNSFVIAPLSPQEKISVAIDGLHASRTTVISKSTASDHLSMITIHVHEHGLSPDDLSKTIDILTRPSSLKKSQALQLLKLLYPREKIDDDIVIRIVGCLGVGQGKADQLVQVCLLRWLVLIQPFLKSQKILSKVYQILFMHLSYESTRQWIAHLLFLATKRHDIRPWRIQYLLEMQNKYRESQHLTGLLLLYKEYFPEIVIDRFAKLRGALFRYPDPQFLSVIREVHARANSLSGAVPSFPRDGLRNLKRRKLNIPEMVTLDVSAKSVTVEELSTLASFAKNIDRVSLPAQVGSVLRDDGMVKRILVNRPSQRAWARLNTWIASSLREELEDAEENGNRGEGLLGELLARSYDLCLYTKELLISVEDFLCIYLPRWDGVRHRSTVFKLLLLMPLRRWEIIDRDITSPLTAIFQKDTENWSFRYDYLVFLEDLLRSYSVRCGKVPSYGRDGEVDGLSHAEAVKTMSSLFAHWESMFKKVSYSDPGATEIQGASLYMYDVVQMYVNR
ncbi:centromere protein I [Lipomyces chichibuensis]|uniref:centromere protein I n=1 Tax=Lipomyces chichibuensis TaxID=1546026 RepID=UPI0033436C5F